MNELFKTFWNVRFDLVSVVFKNCHIDEFVFFCGLKVEAILLAELFLHFRKRRVNKDFLKLANYLVKLIVFGIVVTIVANFEILVFAKIITDKVLSYMKKRRYIFAES